jgi:hypothetical protein
MILAASTLQTDKNLQGQEGRGGVDRWLIEELTEEGNARMMKRK